MNDVVEIYRQTGDFERSVKESGLPALSAHIKLLRSGVLKIEDKIKYSSKAGQLGAKAEEMFGNLVPTAVNANKHIRRNNPEFDFYYGNLKIDVKYSSLHVRNKNKAWKFKVTGEQDLTVAFLEKDVGKELSYPYIVVIPKQLNENVVHFNITKGSQRFWDFIVDKKDLNNVLASYNAMLVKQNERV